MGLNDTAIKICAVPGCNRSARSAGACANHYNQKRQGTSDGVRPGQGKRKLTAADCAAIKKRSSAFATQQTIAREFGVSVDLIRSVLRGTYKPAPEAPDKT